MFGLIAGVTNPIACHLYVKLCKIIFSCLLLALFPQQIASGMKCLEKQNFVHRTLCAKNVLITKHNVCKVADYGQAKLMDESHFDAFGCKYISLGKERGYSFTS